jgi:hypothetical protein
MLVDNRVHNKDVVDSVQPLDLVLCKVGDVYLLLLPRCLYTELQIGGFAAACCKYGTALQALVPGLVEA